MPTYLWQILYFKILYFHRISTTKGCRLSLKYIKYNIYSVRIFWGPSHVGNVTWRKTKVGSNLILKYKTCFWVCPNNNSIVYLIIEHWYWELAKFNSFIGNFNREPGLSVILLLGTRSLTSRRGWGNTGRRLILSCELTWLEHFLFWITFKAHHS